MELNSVPETEQKLKDIAARSGRSVSGRMPPIESAPRSSKLFRTPSSSRMQDIAAPTSPVDRCGLSECAILVAYAPNEKPLWVVAVIHGQRDPQVMAAILRKREE